MSEIKTFFKGGKGILTPIDVDGNIIKEGDILTHSYFHEGKDEFFKIHYPKLTANEIEEIVNKPSVIVKWNTNGYFYGVGINSDSYMHDFMFKNTKKINKMKTKLLIIGNARHGKDSLAELLNEHFGLRFVSSSQAASEIFIFDRLKDKYGYETPEDCFEDRVNHRAEWFDLIGEYNFEDKAKLAKDILKKADCYVGMRDKEEINECIKQGLFNRIIWVDASNRLPLEGNDSFNIDSSCADTIIYNNGTFEEFKAEALKLGESLIQKETEICGK